MNVAVFVIIIIMNVVFALALYAFHFINHQRLMLSLVIFIIRSVCVCVFLHLCLPEVLRKRNMVVFCLFVCLCGFYCDLQFYACLFINVCLLVWMLFLSFAFFHCFKYIPCCIYAISYNVNWIFIHPQKTTFLLCLFFSNWNLSWELYILNIFESIAIVL